MKKYVKRELKWNPDENDSYKIDVLTQKIAKK